jgi:hypothetical protein
VLLEEKLVSQIGRKTREEIVLKSLPLALFIAWAFRPLVHEIGQVGFDLFGSEGHPGSGCEGVVPGFLEKTFLARILFDGTLGFGRSKVRVVTLDTAKVCG